MAFVPRSPLRTMCVIEFLLLDKGDCQVKEAAQGAPGPHGPTANIVNIVKYLYSRFLLTTGQVY